MKIISETYVVHFNQSIVLGYHSIPKLIGDHFGVDVKRNGDPFGVDLGITSGLEIISGAVRDHASK